MFPKDIKFSKLLLTWLFFHYIISAQLEFRGRIDNAATEFPEYEQFIRKHEYIDVKA